MFRFARIQMVSLLSLLAGFSSMVSADVRLPHVISDNMVLQREKPIVIWGWADAGEKVAVTLKDRKAEATADAKGAWQVKLEAMPAGGPHELVVAGRNTITVKNVLVGDIWVASGQSNMEMSVNSSADGAKEVAAADFPKIRLLTVPHKLSGIPMQDADVKWSECSPKTIGSFSAAAYFFGRQLHKELNVPIGLINTSWGGTPIEPWTSPAGFESVPKLAAQAERIHKADKEYRRLMQKHLDQVEAWVAAMRKALDQPGDLPEMPSAPEHPLLAGKTGAPSAMYNGMVHPLVPLPIRGVIWYQGEANTVGDDGMMYYEKMKALIGGWRQAWGQGDFPFYFVQLSPWQYQVKYPSAGGPTRLPRVWQAQLASLSIPNTGMAVITDIGDPKDIHPKNKQGVGQRLALWALAKEYGKKDLVCSGPLYKSMKVENGGIRIEFEYVGGGLAARDGKPLDGFLIAGEDKNFVEAQAKIDGTSVIVSSEKVAKPVAVRFGWDELAQPNLINKEGLPASPFRTDEW